MNLLGICILHGHPHLIRKNTELELPQTVLLGCLRVSYLLFSEAGTKKGFKTLGEFIWFPFCVKALSITKSVVFFFFVFLEKKVVIILENYFRKKFPEQVVCLL